MSFLERRGLVPPQEIDPDLETEITTYLEDVQSLFAGIPNLTEARLTDPQDKVYSLIPSVDPETGRWSKIRIEPKRITAEEPYSYTLSPKDVIISLASINRDQIKAEQMKPLAERLALAQAKIESLLLPIRAARNSTTAEEASQS